MLAILLAAGAGRRVGQPKALLELGGRTALALCLEALEDGGVSRRRVVLGADAERIRGLEDLDHVEVVVNPHPDRGQTSSLRIALEAGPADDVLLHTVDHPLARATDVARLLEAWRTRPAGAAIVVPSVDGRRGHPCLYAAGLVPEFLALADEEPAHRVIRADPGRVLHVTSTHEWLIRDIDRPEDVDSARAALAAGIDED